MKNKELLDKYTSRFVAEGLIKSVLLSSTLGFALSLVAAVVSLATGIKLIWLSVVLFFAANAVGIPTLYYAKFRPATSRIANKLDKLGLQERVVTMLELSDDNSDLARIQRDDTKEQLGFLNPERIKFVVPKSLIICFFVVASISIAMNAIAVFYAGCRHVWGDWIVTQPASCVSTGEESRFCVKNPSHYQKRQIAVNDSHDWGDWVLTAPAQADAEGEETRTCRSNPDHIEKRAVPPSGTEGLLFSKVQYIDENNAISGYAVSVGAAKDSEIFIPSIFCGEPIISIGFSGFQNSSVTSIRLPESIFIIDAHAFAYCRFLQSIEIPSNVNVVQHAAFNQCESLESVTFAGETHITGDAFAGCISLKSIKLTGNTYIGADAFAGCAALTDVFYDGSPAQWRNLIDNLKEGNEALLNATVHFLSETAPGDKSAAFAQRCLFARKDEDWNNSSFS